MSRPSSIDSRLSSDYDFNEETADFSAELEADGFCAEGIADAVELSTPKGHQSKQSRDQPFDAAQIYLKAAQRSKLLTPEEEQHYGHLTRQGDQAARKIMIESNLRLVVCISRRYFNRGLPLIDMIEEGNIGLIHAVEKFRPELGFRFSTYATWWIRQSIERAIMNQCRTVRLPIKVLKEMNACLKAFRLLADSLDREPTAADVAKQMDKPLTRVERMITLSERVTAGDLSLAGEGGSHLADTIADEDRPSPVDMMHQLGMASHISTWLAQLTEVQREVISRRFGLCGYDPSNFLEIAEAMHLPRDRVRQLQTESMGLLRKMAADEGLLIDAIFL
jgi:RNA polymerase nonessential primary-like sigma factor